MAGETVIVRDAAGRLLLRRVWEADDQKVYICSEDNYVNLASGRPGLSAVGFPREDVFVLNPAVLEAVQDGARPAAGFWDSLSQW